MVAAVATAYAVWTGIGAVGVTIAGVVVFSAMIVVSLAGLRFVES
ncbi:SMR family transporter [Mycolicibacterium fortuitum]|nr:SMR family transporter [Mycolicibacterium fortuitum]